MEQGWISLNRQVKDNWIWKDKPYAKGQAWIDILLRVNHKSNKVPVGTSVVDVAEGQTIWSIEDMAKSWGWSRTKVSNFLNVLETESQIAQKRTSKHTLLTVTNWALYQNKEHQKNITGTSKEHHGNTNNNDNNDNKKDMSEFNAIRKEFKGTKVKSVADKKLHKLIKKYSFVQMLETVRRYNGYIEQQRQQGFNSLKYVNESTFWNGRYIDYLDENYIDTKKTEKPNEDWRNVQWSNE